MTPDVRHWYAESTYLAKAVDASAGEQAQVQRHDGFSYLPERFLVSRERKESTVALFRGASQMCLRLLSVIALGLFVVFLLPLYLANTYSTSKGQPEVVVVAAAAMKSAEFRTFNRLAEQMTYYHSMLRATWDELYASTASTSKAPASRVINVGLHFCQHLKGHHDIEEAVWFPVLATKMQGFREGEFAKLQHEEMHKGLDVLQPYLMDCKRGIQDFHRQKVRNIMDSFGGILWKHMDEEVQELGAENMEKHWTLQEMRQIPF